MRTGNVKYTVQNFCHETYQLLQLLRLALLPRALQRRALLALRVDALGRQARVVRVLDERGRARVRAQRHDDLQLRERAAARREGPRLWLAR